MGDTGDGASAESWPLSGLSVLDISSGIAGGYCSRLLADGGADVLKVESPGGDPLRRRATGASLTDSDDGALFLHLACSKRGAVADPRDSADVEAVLAHAAAANVIIWSPGSEFAEDHRLAPSVLVHRAPNAILAAITPVGLTGPWAERAHTEFTLQGWAGSAATRGDPDGPPMVAGGRTGEWAAGLFAALAVLTALRDTGPSGHVVDISMYESIICTHNLYPVTAPSRMTRVKNFPGIVRSKDSLVGFTVGTGQQWLDFCTMIERDDWAADPELMLFTKRFERRSELLPALEEWCLERTTAEIIGQATAFRLPVAEIGNGATLPTFDQCVERKWYVTNPSGRFIQPDVSYTLSTGAGRRPAFTPPVLGERRIAEIPTAPAQRGIASASDHRLPFEGIRVADFTNAWAGPFMTHQLALFGADVIRVESIQRLDTLRLAVPNMDADSWWETALFAAANTNKRSVTLDMNSEVGQRLGRRLCLECDVVVDNFSPRVMDGWGLGYESLRADRPDIIQVRMPAFGLYGPWRDRVGWAQTMEQLSGMAWITGFPNDVPETPTGPCDPLGGGHALLGLLLALRHRDLTGEGLLVESPLFGGAIAVTAEQAIEYSAYGHLLERTGNRETNAVQGVYRCRGELPDGRDDRWVAIAVENEVQWRGLVHALGRPAWAAELADRSIDHLRSKHDLLDGRLAAWCRHRSADEIVDRLWAFGVPVSKMVVGQELIESPQLAARGWWTELTHPVAGTASYGGSPIRIDGLQADLHRSPAPTLGQHNHDVLTGLLGLTESAIDELVRDGVVGTLPVGHRARGA